jgi:excisionase family DNA binding protein
MFLTPAQIAAAYPVSKSTIYGACQNGLLPHYRVPARKGARGKYLVKEEDLLAWLESLRVEGCGPQDDGPLEHIR